MNKNARLKTFESQNWKCAYCGTRMWKEALFDCHEQQIAYKNEFAISMGFPTLKSMNINQIQLFKSLEATLDHINPQSKGGKLNLTNRVGACKRCNILKGRQHVVQFMRQMVQV